MLKAQIWRICTWKSSKRRAARVALTPHSSCYCELGNLANRDQISACAPVWYSIKEAQRHRGISLGAAVWHFFNCEKGGDLTAWLSACITLIWFAVRWQCVIAQGRATNLVLGDISLSVSCVLYQQAPMKFLLNMTSWSLNRGYMKESLAVRFRPPSLWPCKCISPACHQFSSIFNLNIINQKVNFWAF